MPDSVYENYSNIRLQNILDMVTGDCYKNQPKLSDQIKSVIEMSGIIDPLERLKLLYKMLKINSCLEINDENSPYIASMLYNVGFDIDTGCI
jgi:hypothetical protein